MFPRLITRPVAWAFVALVLATGQACTQGPGGCAPPRQPARGDARQSQRPPSTIQAAPSRHVDGRADAQDRQLPVPAEGTVVRVRDGDSLVVRVGVAEVETRLDSIDAPELAQTFGYRARSCTVDLAFGRQVRLEFRGKDKYDRELVEVFLPDGRSLNQELVSAGCAWRFRRFSTDPDLEAREQQARAARRGLWADPDPIPPWEFRERNPRRK